MQKCTLALGCFWKPEENFKNKPGILETEVGYAGGAKAQVTYEEVCTGNTGHAEVVKLTFDENKVSYKKRTCIWSKLGQNQGTFLIYTKITIPQNHVFE